MRILDRFEVVSTGRRSMIPSYQRKLISNMDSSGPVLDAATYGEYTELRLTLGVRYLVTGNFQRDIAAYDNARRQIQQNLYGDILDHLRACKSAMYEFDEEAMLQAISAMESIMTDIT
jgi:hypothetical protein